MAEEGGINIGGHKLSYKVLALGAAGAAVIFIVAKGGGNSLQTSGAPATQDITTQVPVAPDLTPITNSITDLQKQLKDEYGQLLDYQKKQPQVYQVQAGDTWVSIAQKFGVGTKDIRSWNAWISGKANQYVGRYIEVA